MSDRPAMQDMSAFVKFRQLEAELEDYDVKIDVSIDNISLIYGQDLLKLYRTVEEFNAGATMLLCALNGDLELDACDDDGDDADADIVDEDDQIEQELAQSQETENDAPGKSPV